MSHLPASREWNYQRKRDFPDCQDCGVISAPSSITVILKVLPLFLTKVMCAAKDCQGYPEKVSMRSCIMTTASWMHACPGRGGIAILQPSTNDYGQLDLSVNYNINPHFSIQAQILNMTKEQRIDQSTSRYLPYGVNELDRRFLLGIRMTF